MTYRIVEEIIRSKKFYYVEFNVFGTNLWKELMETVITPIRMFDQTRVFRSAKRAESWLNHHVKNMIANRKEINIVKEIRIN